jgi:hypothetical protein
MSFGMNQSWSSSIALTSAIKNDHRNPLKIFKDSLAALYNLCLWITYIIPPAVYFFKTTNLLFCNQNSLLYPLKFFLPVAITSNSNFKIRVFNGINNFRFIGKGSLAIIILRFGLSDMVYIIES